MCLPHVQAPESVKSDNYDLRMAAWYSLVLIWYWCLTGTHALAVPRGQKVTYRIEVPRHWSDEAKQFAKVRDVWQKGEGSKVLFRASFALFYF